MRRLVNIPAYNEEESIVSVIDDLQKNAPEFDYIIINDGSTDNTFDICVKNGYHCINLPVNLGIGGAVQTGYMYGARNGYDYAVQFDGDGQHSAAFLDQMVKTLQELDADMVIGSRFIENEGFQSSKMRRVGITFLSGLIRAVTGRRITDPTSGMRMVNRTVMEMYADHYPKDYPEPESLVQIIAAGKKVCEMPVLMNERQGGVSSISPRKSVYYMVKVSMAIIFAGIRIRRGHS